MKINKLCNVIAIMQDGSEIRLARVPFADAMRMSRRWAKRLLLRLEGVVMVTVEG